MVRRQNAIIVSRQRVEQTLFLNAVWWLKTAANARFLLQDEMGSLPDSERLIPNEVWVQQVVGDTRQLSTVIPEGDARRRISSDMAMLR
jgi:hypothetical protein